MGARHRDLEDGGTADAAYTARLRRLSGARWKRFLDVQRPYRWNLQRLRLGRVLDLGCGIGRNLAALPGAVGVDHNPTSVAEARVAGFTAWTTREWSTCPDAVPSSYDTLLVAHVLEHLNGEEARALLREYLPYLKDRSRIVLICPQERGYACDATHVRFVDLEQMRSYARELGFVPVREYSFPFPRLAGLVFPYNEFVLVARRGS
ncbi:MAG: class I SAM-dependent methyltransferase [Deltaproteobacteria bacterium]|nr:class I SAM-dependent methyltransferase [Deltaproteobacteria bacterium]